MTYQEFMKLPDKDKEVILTKILELANAMQRHLVEQPKKDKE